MFATDMSPTIRNTSLSDWATPWNFSWFHRLISESGLAWACA